MHSTASDGQYTPSELVKLAREEGIEVMALTDHDTIDGVEEAITAGNKFGLRVIRGVELSADDYLNLHILGYNFSPDAEELKNFILELKNGRDVRKYTISNYLREKGVDLPLEEVEKLAEGGVIGRPHFAEAMASLGFVKNRREAFDLYLDTPEFHEVDRGKPKAKKCIEVIKNSGGKVSFAHPYQVVLKGESMEELVSRLGNYGLDAIECYYPRHTPEQVEYYLDLTKRFGLHVTGGSDFHGEKFKPDIHLARWELDLNWILQTKEQS